MSKGIAGKLLDNPIQLALGIAVVIGVVYYVGRKVVTDVASTGASIVSGDNAITRGTPYQGAGILGTLGSAANTALGGVPQSVGERLGDWLFELTHKDYDPNEGLTTGARIVKQGAANTQALWGSIGGVELRAQ
jgi:hypothetical protein